MAILKAFDFFLKLISLATPSNSLTNSSGDTENSEASEWQKPLKDSLPPSNFKSKP
jgi:hypothetical protein